MERGRVRLPFPSLHPNSGFSCPPGSHVERKSFRPSLGIPTSFSHDYSLLWASLRSPVGLPSSEQVHRGSTEMGGINTEWQNPAPSFL